MKPISLTLSSWLKRDISDHVLERPAASGMFALPMLVSLFAGACQQVSTGRCVQTTDCAPTEACRLGECRPLDVLSADSGKVPIDAGRDGGIPLTCAAGGTCLLGEKCEKSGDCKSQFCADGVCCNERCGTACASCNKIASVGTCKPKEKGAACGAYVCDGTSPLCPSTCATIEDCSYAYTCCQPGRSPEDTDCVARGLTSTCFQLPACSSIRDTFEQAQLDTSKWAETITVDGGQPLVSNGGLQFALNYPSSAVDAYTAIYLKKSVSLVGSSCQVDVSNTSVFEGSSAFAVAGLVVTTNSGDLELRVIQDSKVAAHESPLGKEVPIVFSGELPKQGRRIMRLSEDAGVVHFEYSTDGQTFKTLDSRRTQMRTSDVLVQLSVYENVVNRDAGGVVTMDNFNAPQ